MAVILPAGFAAAGGACGIKADGTKDLGILVVEPAASWTGVFTRNAAAAAPVSWSRERLGIPVRAVVVNSGNANACAGKRGFDAVRATAERAAASLGCLSGEVLVASTGPIGIPLPVPKILDGIPGLVTELTPDADGFAHSILTTDTCIKTARAVAGDAQVVGIAKGAAMIAPNMATMLAFIATDAAADAAVLRDCLGRATQKSFNRISVDGCASTNDSVFLLASGVVGTDAAALCAAVESVCSSLAEQIVGDAEGGSKLMRIAVSGAVDDESAEGLARAVAASALWRAAVHGADPNWGRVMAALGEHKHDLDLENVSVSIGDVTVFDRGEPTGSLAAAAAVLDGPEIVVACGVGLGPGTAELLTTDLSPAYVELNAYGTT